MGVLGMGFLKLDPGLGSYHRQTEGSFQGRGDRLPLGCQRKRHFQLQRGWSDLAAQTATGGYNNQHQSSSTIEPRTSWMTPSRTGCDLLDYRTSGNTSWRAMTHQVQM